LKKTKKQTILKQFKKKRFLRSRDLDALNISREYLNKVYTEAFLNDRVEGSETKKNQRVFANASKLTSCLSSITWSSLARV
jgi:hypothetical protein